MELLLDRPTLQAVALLVPGRVALLLLVLLVLQVHPRTLRAAVLLEAQPILQDRLDRHTLQVPEAVLKVPHQLLTLQGLHRLMDQLLVLLVLLPLLALMLQALDQDHLLSVVLNPVNQLLPLEEVPPSQLLALEVRPHLTRPQLGPSLTALTLALARRSLSAARH